MSHSAGWAPSISARSGLAALVAVAAILHATSSFANDSTASLDAGGLKLTFNPNVSLCATGIKRTAHDLHNVG